MHGEKIVFLNKPLDQWFLTFFAPWTPKSQKMSMDTKLSKCTTCGPLNTYKRGLKGYTTSIVYTSRTPWGSMGPRLKTYLCYRRIAI